jgi:predicted transcriptional regulator of viral defense system
MFSTNGGAPEGISMVELKEKTGLAERQIWSIVNRASKAGKIKKVKRGVYGAVKLKKHVSCSMEKPNTKEE